jgi:tetratricopeptide (TPR) repeat protein
MSEVNLKEYFQRLDRLLKANAADEVIHHARHILRYYPRNVQVYRFLGRALVLIGRYEEAEAALRRVLGVLPDDFIANVALGEVFERTNRCEDAIYHLERALDQQPSDKDLLDALRVLYHRCRKTGQLKIQMTAGTVARQHWRSGAPDYAIDTLRSALKSAPDRIDLRLLLAQILWAAGREEEAAESALEVIRHLPDSLDANRIMAELWLKYSRPSDAQRFVNRIESVDPYLAVELVQGTPPPDDAFRIEELDYVRSAQSEAVTARPDWLKDLGAAGDLPAAPTAEPQEEAWSSWSSAMLSSTPAAETPTESQPENDLEWLTAFPTVREDDAPIIPTSPSDSELDALFSTGGLDAERLPYTPPAPPEPDSDPFAWMRDAGIDVDENAPARSMALDEPDFDDLYTPPAASAGAQAEADADPLFWMRDAGVEMVDEQPGADVLGEAAAFDDLFGSPGGGAFDEPEDRPIEEPDAFAWMQGYDTGLTTDTPAPYDPYAPIDAPAPYDPYAASADEDDLFALAPAQPAEVYDPYAAAGDDEPEADSLDWLNATPDARPAGDSLPFPDEDDLLFDAAPTAPPQDAPASPPSMRGLTAILNEGNFDWMKSADAAAGAEPDDDEWLAQFGAAPAKPASASDSPDWLTDLDPSPDRVSALADIPAAESDDDLFAIQPEEQSWMSDPERRDDDLSMPQGDDQEMDWLTQFAPTESTSADSPSAPAMSDDDDVWANLMGVGDDTADRLSFADTVITTDPLDSASPAGEPGDDDDESIPDWLRDSAPSVVETQASGFAAEELDWLNDSSITDAEEVLSAAALHADLDELSDLGEMRLYSGDVESADELTFEIDPLEPPSEQDDDATIESVPDWLSDIRATDSGESATEQAVDFTLSEIAPSASEPDDDFAWLNDAAPVAEAETVAPAAEQADDFAWLNDAAPVAEAETVAPAAEQADDFAWLNDAAPVAEAEAAEPAAEQADDFAWLNDAAPVAEAETVEPAAEQADDFAWLNDAAPVAEAEAEQPVAETHEPDFNFEDLQPTDATAVVAEVEDAVMSEREYEDEDDGTAALFEEEVVLEGGDVNTPDWLNAMVPGLDVDVTAQEYILPDEEFDLVEEAPIPIDRSAAGNAEFGWLVRIVEEEVAASQPVRRFSFSRPPAWARPARPPVSDDDDDFPDWIVDDDGK